MALPQDLSPVAAFKKVAEVGNFTTAAQELRMTASAVSRQISRLEESLGIQLIVRTTRNVRLSEPGQIFYEHCSRGLAELEQAIDLVARYRNEPRGHLRVATTPCFGRLHVIPSIIAFLETYPHITVDVTLSHPDVTFLESGMDILIRARGIDNKSIDSATLAPMRHVVCATPDYLARHGTPRLPKDLAQHNCLITTQPAPIYEWPFTRGKRTIHIPVSGSFHTDSLDAVYAAVCEDLGIARLPDYVVAPELESGRLVSLFPGPKKGERGSGYSAETENTMKAHFVKHRFTELKTQAFIDFLQHRFQNNYDWKRRYGTS